MRSRHFGESESLLKRFAKRSKEISYSTALVVAFLITGFVTYAQPDETVLTRTELSEKLSDTKDSIDNKLKLTKKELDKLNLQIAQLLRRGEFWIKPLIPSYQVFFNGTWENTTENKNKTMKNFESPEYTLHGEYNEYIDDLSVPHGKYDMVYDGKYLGTMGIMNRKFTFVDYIDFGANIQPKSVAEKQIKAPEVTEKEVKMVEFTPPETPEIHVHAPSVTIPETQVLQVPTAPTVSVDEPESIVALEPIEIDEMKPIEMEIEKPTVTEPVAVNVPTVKAPETPEGFTPKLITPPEPPQVVIPKVVIPKKVVYSKFGGNIQDEYDYWNGGNDKTMIDQIAITDGKFKATAKKGAYIKGYKGVGGYSATESGLVRGNPSGSIPSDGWNACDRRFFFGIRNSAFIEWSPSVEISWFSDGVTDSRQLLYMETSNVSNKDLDDLRSVMTSDLYNEIKSYKDQTKLREESGGINLHNNKGTIYLGDTETRYQATTTISNLRLSVFNNQGTITGLNMDKGNDGKSGSTKQVVYYNSPDTSNDPQRWIYGNGAAGKINLYGAEAVAMYYTSRDGDLQKYVSTGFVNDGEINLYGVNSSGVVIGESETPKTGTGFYLNKPINIYSDGSRGVYIPANVTKLNADDMIVRATIGKGPNVTTSFEWTDIETNTTKQIKPYSNLDGNEEKYVDNAVGLMYTYGSTANMKAPGITLEKHAKNSIGIYAGAGTLTITDGKIEVNGGISNLGLATKASGEFSGGDLDYTGSISTGENAEEAIVAYSANNKTIKIHGDITANSKNSVALFADGGTIELDTDKKLHIEESGSNSIGAYSKGGTIQMNRATLDANPNIKITGDKTTGIGIYADSNSTIKAGKMNIYVKDGDTGIAAVDGGDLDFTGGKLRYDSSGYAIYTNNGGIVHAEDALIELEGDSTAFDVDLRAGTMPVKLNSNTRIHANSDDVVVFNMKNMSGLTTVGGIEDSIKSSIAGKLGTGVNLQNLFEGSTSTKYKVAAVDGGTIVLGNLDKTGKEGDTESAKKDAYQYYNRFLGQRLVATTQNGAKITANLTSADAADRFNSQVVALEMNSSKQASSVTETGIKLVNATVEANRMDSGNGAVGAFINFGQVDVDEKSKIAVEKLNTPGNEKAVGIYAVNGSQVTNKGEIEVGGNKSIGILGMAYRMKGSSPLKNEFGGKTGEGTISITNNKNITMSGEGAIGIYADNNNPDAAADKHSVVNSGTITVGDSGDSTAIGIYANKVTVKPQDGTINIGDGTIGIYSLNSILGASSEDLGTVKFKGDKGIALYLAGNRDDTNVMSNEIKVENPDNKTGNIGIFVDYTGHGTTPYNLKTLVKVGNADNITAYYAKSGPMNVVTSGKINKNSVGLSGAKGNLLAYGDGTTPVSYEIGENSTAIAGRGNNIDVRNNAEIKLVGEKAVGVYVEGSPTENITAKNHGKVTLNNKHTIGAYAKNKANLNLNDDSEVVFDTDATESIGTYLAGANLKIETAGATGTPMEFTEKPEDKNIFIYMQGYDNGSELVGTNLELDRAVNVKPAVAATGDDRTIGIYMDTTVSNDSTKFVSNELTGNAYAENGGIAVYTKNSATPGSGVYNFFNTVTIGAKDDGTAGIFMDGDIKVTGGSNLNVQNKGVGIYGNSGTLYIDGENNINVKEEGTGIYLTNGAQLSDGTLALKNDAGANGDKKGIGIYYNKGSGNGEIDHNTKLSIKAGDLMLGMYVDGGVHVDNKSDVEITTGTGNTVAYILGGSKFTNNGNITIGGTDLKQALGIYVGNGSAVNEAGKKISVTDDDGTEPTLSVAMAAVKSEDAGATAEVENKGEIEVTGEAVGIYVDEGSSGKNEGTIVAKNTATQKTMGAYIKGQDAKFTNSGDISSDNIVVALEDTKAGNVELGNMTITGDDGVGVYAKNATLDMDIEAQATADKTIAVYADGTTAINGKVTSASGKSHIGVFLNKPTVTFGEDAKVIVSNGSGTDYGIGVYAATGYDGDIKVDIEQKGKETIGMFLGHDSAGSGTPVTKVTYNGTLDIGKGIGVYVPQDTEFVMGPSTMNIDGGAGLFVQDGAISMGNAGTVNINFGNDKGSAIFQQGGSIDIGSDLQVSGHGTFLTLKNADSDVETIIPVMEEGTGINAIYNSHGAGSDYDMKLGPNGKIRLLGDGAIGVAATVTGITPNGVLIENEGEIVTEAGKKVVGILAKGASVKNNGKLTIGEEGIGIFATNDGVDTDTTIENTDVVLTGDKAIGILADKMDTTHAIKAGEIEAKAKEQVGIYGKDSVNTLTVEDIKYESDANGIGAIFEHGDYAVKATAANNSIEIGDANVAVGDKRGMGMASIGAQVTVEKTDITLGKNAIGLYASENGKLKFGSGNLVSNGEGSVLVYADKTGEITLDLPQLEVKAGGIGIAADGGKVLKDPATPHIDVKVDGENAIGVFVAGDATNPGEVSSDFNIIVEQPGGIGIYAKGTVNGYGTLKSMNCDGAKGYIFENMDQAINLPGIIKLGQNGEKDQIGVYAKGTGIGLTTNGIDIKSEGNIGIYNTANQNIANNNGMILADNSGTNSSIGIYSDTSDNDTDARVITAAGDMKVGVNNVGVYAKNNAVNQTGGDVEVKSKGIGILAENTDGYYGNGNVDVAGKLTAHDDGAVGVQTVNADVKLQSDVEVGDNGSVGVYATGKGNIDLDKNLNVGKDSTGLYKNGEGTVTTLAGNTITVDEKGYGIFAEKADIVNAAALTVGEGAVGIAGKADIKSTGEVKVAKSGIGILAKGDGTGTIEIAANGSFDVADNGALGIYADNTNIDIKPGTKFDIGNNDSVGIFSVGKGNIKIDSMEGRTVHEIPVGIDSIGVYKKGSGKLEISDSVMNIGDKGYGIYYVGENGTAEVANTNLNMKLGKEAVGVYAKNASVSHKGNIEVGATTIGPNGYNNPEVNKNSIGIFGESSKIEYSGHMLVDKPLSVGIYGFADSGNTSITLKSGTNLEVKNGAIGIMTGQGISDIVIEPGAEINVSGKAPDAKNPSYGIALFSGVLDNQGKINLSNGATGIHIGGIAGLKNGSTGVINITTGDCKATIDDGIDDTGNLGGVVINSKGEVTINDKVVNGGTIDIKGDLTMDGMGIDIANKLPVIKANKIQGEAVVLPNFSLGNSEQKVTVADVFRPTPGGIGTFSGNVTSASVSWIAKISKEFGTTSTKDITLARIPYESMIVGEKYKGLATGLEELRMEIPVTQSSEEFKSLDEITDHETFGEAIANIRGDIFANVQERMQTIENTFNRSYTELLDSYNKTRNAHKFSVINTNGRHKDDTLGVAGYKYDSVGLLYMNDMERYSYGGKFGWSAGLVGTRFKFTGLTGDGSKERVISGKLGLHYQHALDEKDDNAQLKYLGRAEVALNRHRAKRHMQLGKDSYTNKSTYHSMDISLRNRIQYDYDMNTQWTVKPYAGLDLSYGRFSKIKEKSNMFDVEVKDNDYFLVTPNVGVETKYRIPVGEKNEVVVKADAQVSYDAHKLYTGANKAKLKKSSSEYYKLSEPEKDRVEVGVGAEIGIAQAENYSVSFRAEYNDNNKSNMTYGVRLNYRF